MEPAKIHRDVNYLRTQKHTHYLPELRVQRNKKISVIHHQSHHLSRSATRYINRNIPKVSLNEMTIQKAVIAYTKCRIELPIPNTHCVMRQTVFKNDFIITIKWAAGKNAVIYIDWHRIYATHHLDAVIGMMLQYKKNEHIGNF